MHHYMKLRRFPSAPSVLQVLGGAQRALRTCCVVAAGTAVAAGQNVDVREELARLTEVIREQQAQIEALQTALANQSEMLGNLQGQFYGPDPSPASMDSASESTEPKPGTIGNDRLSLQAGGFVEATAMVRSRNQNADVGETFGNIPLDGTANAALSSFRMSSRHSRLSLLVKANGGNIKATGYFEGDFLGSSTSANEVESNDFPLRVRQFFGDVEFANGLSVTAGQTWTLLTTHQAGLRPLDEHLTLALSAQHVVGFNWARQTGFRFTKDFGHGVWAAAAIENPETHTGGVVVPPGTFGLSSSPNAQVPAATFASSLTPGANGISTDLAPDVVAKMVFEPGWGHYEVKGVSRWFRSRFEGRNTAALGGGIGAAALLPLSNWTCCWKDWPVAGSGATRLQWGPTSLSALTGQSTRFGRSKRSRDLIGNRQVLCRSTTTSGPSSMAALHSLIRRSDTGPPGWTSHPVFPKRVFPAAEATARSGRSCRESGTA